MYSLFAVYSEQDLCTHLLENFCYNFPVQFVILSYQNGLSGPVKICLGSGKCGGSPRSFLKAGDLQRNGYSKTRAFSQFAVHRDFTAHLLN